MRIFLIFGFLTAAALYSINVWAFGTIRKNGVLPQDLEHERITRRAYACDIANPGPDCIESKTLNKLAGKSRLLFGTFGGVGYPDKPGTEIEEISILTDYSFLEVGERPKAGQSLSGLKLAHCDGADFIAEVENYPTTPEQAEALITGCRQWMDDHFKAAVAAASGMVDNGQIIKRETKLNTNCITWPLGKKSAKCEVLSHFGIMLHAAQDFYSHSNWNDRPEPGAITSKNPPGLAGNGPAPWLAMPVSNTAFPNGLISGCYDGFPESSYCQEENADGEIIRRTKHADLNKDHGVVDPDPGTPDAKSFPDVGPIGPGYSNRGKHNENFQNSVHAAILDSRRKLANFKSELENQYGADDAALIFCALIKDKPARNCMP